MTDGDQQAAPWRTGPRGPAAQYESIKAKEASERESLITLVAPYLLKKIAIGGGSSGTPDAPAIGNDREFGNTMWVRVHERSELLADYQKELGLAEKLRQRIARDMH